MRFPRLAERLIRHPFPPPLVRQALAMPDPGRDPARRRRGLRRLACRLRELGVL